MKSNPRPAKFEDFIKPEFIGKSVDDYEVTSNGSLVRKDRWENGLRKVANALGFTNRYKISDVLDELSFLVNKSDTDKLPLPMEEDDPVHTELPFVSLTQAPSALQAYKLSRWTKAKAKAEAETKAKAEAKEIATCLVKVKLPLPIKKDALVEYETVEPVEESSRQITVHYQNMYMENGSVLLGDSRSKSCDQCISRRSPKEWVGVFKVTFCAGKFKSSKVLTHVVPPEMMES